MKSKHRTLVVGVGSIGERHVRCLLRTGRAEVGVCELNAGLRDKVAHAYDVVGAYESLDAALSARWDAAVIATPANLHIPLAIQTVDAGMATLIEKPLSITSDGVDRLSRMAALKGVPVGVAYVYRAHGAVRAMREHIASGRLGDPLQVTAVCGQNFPTYRPAYAQTYYARHEAGGGAIQDALTHIFNAAEWMVGPITRIAADAAHLQLPDVTVEDTVHALARHSNVMACYSLNQHQAPNEATITVVCRRGVARLELHHHAWRWMNAPDTPWEEQVTSYVERDDWFTAQENNWLDVVEGKADPLCTLAEGSQTLHVNQAALASARAGGQWMNVGYAQKEIVL